MDDYKRVHKGSSSWFALGSIVAFGLSMASLTGKLCNFNSDICNKVPRSGETSIILFSIGSILLFISIYLMSRKNTLYAKKNK